jgi:hypothetical protein
MQFDQSNRREIIPLVGGAGACASRTSEGARLCDCSCARRFYRLEPHPQAPKLAPDTNGLIWLPEATFETAFAQHASADDRAILAVQRPISLSCIAVPVGRPLWRDVPRWFLIAEDDRMIIAQTQRYMAQRMKAKVKVHAVDHAPQRHRSRSCGRHYSRCNALCIR